MSSEPMPAQSRPRGWALTWRYGLAIGYLLVTLLLGIAAAAVDQVAPSLAVTEVVFGIAGLFLIRLRHRRPVTTAVVLLLMASLATTVGLLVAWALAHVATRRRWKEMLPLGLLALVLSLVTVWLQIEVFKTLDTAGIPGWLMYLQIAVFAVLAIAVSLAIGFSVGARRDLLASLRQRAEQAELTQELMVLQGQAAERNRIAREMHDVLAHRISLVSMHAGALAYRTDLPPDDVRQVAALIQENAHQSLEELRAVLGSLREDAPAAAVAGSGAGASAVAKPQPTIAQVDDLVADARAAGARVDYTNTVEHPELLPTSTGRHVYRVVQESLTNARKHAPHARVTVQLWGRPGDGLAVRSTNPTLRSSNPTVRSTNAVATASSTKASGEPVVPGAGVGLLGLAERAQMSGGRISHRVDEDGVFELEVWLPW
ncbi:sensor histidine kinase [Propionibacteriaceae bacterium G57]|uniref:sensor histidine kinase n=1 Tax=Aestuariimicrobium sp. G57 TaxID=3418485 RepID=UPI003DA71A87